MDAAIADRLGKMLRLLASDHDGEVVAAAKAIVRTLESNSLDIHALADAVETKQWSNDEALEMYRRGIAEGKAHGERGDDGFKDVKREPSWYEIATVCESHVYRFLSREQEFIHDMVRRLVHGGEPTEKQGAWLRALFVRCRKW
jgi:hypothetical protein